MKWKYSAPSLFSLLSGCLYTIILCKLMYWCQKVFCGELLCQKFAFHKIVQCNTCTSIKLKDISRAMDQFIPLISTIGRSYTMRGMCKSAICIIMHRTRRYLLLAMHQFMPKYPTIARSYVMRGMCKCAMCIIMHCNRRDVLAPMQWTLWDGLGSYSRKLNPREAPFYRSHSAFSFGFNLFSFRFILLKVSMS